MDEFNRKEFLSSVSNSCGVYVMVGADNSCLYIGKAKNLKKRLASHLRPSSLSHRFRAVMSHLVDIETIVTSTETEALLLENNLIKTRKPKYNIDLRDDKSYPYIRLDDSHEYPGLAFYRGNRKQPGKYFGPFSSASAVRSTLSQIQKIFPIRQCQDSFFKHRSRPCLQYQIDRCSGPCVGLIDHDSYLQDVEQAANFLAGKNHRLLRMLTRQMDESAAKMDFENAAKYRDRIAAVQRLRETQYVEGGDANFDVIAVERASGVLCVQLVLIRSGRNIEYRTFFPKVSMDLKLSKVLSEFVARHYLGRQVPSLIAVDRNFPDRLVIEQALGEQTGRKVEIRVPQRGAKVKMIEMAKKNARNAIRKRASDKNLYNSRYCALANTFGIEGSLYRVECYDISHTAGQQTVASCVAFDVNGPDKSRYRRFNVAGIEPGDDYAAIRNALQRRFRHHTKSEENLPDMVLIDGGRGQLGVASDVFDELQVRGVLLLAISKGPNRKPAEDQFWLPGSRSPLELDLEAKLQLQHIRDEAHRFALLGHRKRRSVAQQRSVLEDIPGIGRKRRSKLLKHFGGLQGVSRAGIEELSGVKGISPRLAEKIYYSFHQSG